MSNVQLRAVLRARHVRNVQELGAALVVDGSPLRALLDLVLSVCVFDRPSRHHTVNTLVVQLRTGHMERSARIAVQQCFGVYCALRRAAVPLSSTGAT